VPSRAFATPPACPRRARSGAQRLYPYGESRLAQRLQGRRDLARGCERSTAGFRFKSPGRAPI